MFLLNLLMKALGLTLAKGDDKCSELVTARAQPCTRLNILMMLGFLILTWITDMIVSSAPSPSPTALLLPFDDQDYGCYCL